MDLDALDPERLEAALMDTGALSVTLTDAGDAPVLEPLPGEMRLWPDTRVTALYDAAADFDAVRRDLRQSLGVTTLPSHHLEDLADRVWEREWLRDFGPMRFGRRLWVAPGEELADGDGATVIRLDPGLAFGTGTHATTALCLHWLDANPPEGLEVLDFGCGSGILAIAALMLGARSVTAVDIDLQALAATRQNAERNGVAGRLAVAGELPTPSRQFDLVLANILAGTLEMHADGLLARLRPGGALVLSGILEHQAAEVEAAFAARATFDKPVRKDGWTRLSGTRLAD